MAKKTPLTAAQIKEQKTNLKLAGKELDTALAAHTKAAKESRKVLADVKKEADKAIAAASKAHETVAKKHTKAAEAHAKGKAKIDAQLAALSPVVEEALV